jgi:hypothetical protein
MVPTRVSHVRSGSHSGTHCGPPTARDARRRSGRHLRFHQRLGQHADAFPQDVPVLLFEELANERGPIHAGLGDRHRPPCCVLPPERTHGTMRDGRSRCLRPPTNRISTTSWDSNQEKERPLAETNLSRQFWDWLRCTHYDSAAVLVELRWQIRAHMAIHLVTLIGGHVDVLPFMLEHYRQLGVDAFSVNVHTKDGDDPVRGEVEAIADRFGCGVENVVTGDWLDHELSAWVASMRRYPNDWWVIADQDEFHLFPDTLSSLLAFCERRGYDHVQGTFVDRVSADGRFTEIDLSQQLWSQYPLGGLVSARLFGALSLKVTAAKGSVVINTGHHLALHAHPCPIQDAFSQVHHFKWTRGVVERQEWRAQHFRQANVSHWTESARVVNYAATHQHRIDVHDREFLLAPCTPAYPHFDFLTSLVQSRLRRRAMATAESEH